VKKRTFDVAVISLAAVVWVPVVLAAAAAVLLLSGRPIFYRSHRWVGPSAAINMLKLRVMVPDANRVKAPVAAGRFLSTPPDSPLYTPIGRILDRLGLNEIPQFLHVLRGQMNLVGPRPLTDHVHAALGDQHPSLDDRWLSPLTPAGLTGLPQLVGRMDLTDEQRLQLEAAYSHAVHERYSVRLDFLILLYTILITFGLKRPMSYPDALGMARSRPARELGRIRGIRRRAVTRRLTASHLTAQVEADSDAVA